MVKKILIILLVLLCTLTSLTAKKESDIFILSEPTELRVFEKVSSKVVTEVSFSPSLLIALGKSEGKSPTALISELYSTDNLQVTIFTTEEKERLTKLLTSLNYITGGNNGIISFVQLEKDLRKTEFEDTIYSLMKKEKDDKTLFSIFKKNTKLITVLGDDFISPAAPWDEKVEFFHTWTEQIGSYI